MILKQIIKAFKIAEKRNWDKVYYAFDIHETILYPDYNNVDPLKYYPYAKEALQLITTHPMIVSFLYTCSHKDEIDRYSTFFKENEIHFKYVNHNPEVKNDRLGCFDFKPYFNVYFEDKCGFDAESEWKNVHEYFVNDLMFRNSKTWDELAKSDSLSFGLRNKKDAEKFNKELKRIIETERGK